MTMGQACRLDSTRPGTPWFRALGQNAREPAFPADQQQPLHDASRMLTANLPFSDQAALSDQFVAVAMTVRVASSIASTSSLVRTRDADSRSRE